MKKIVYFFLILIFTASASFAAGLPGCNIHYTDEIQSFYFPKNIEFPNVKVEGIPLSQYVQQVVKKMTGKVFTGATFDEAVEAVFKSVDAKNISYAKKSEQMSKLARELNPAFEKYISKFPKKGSITNPNLEAWAARKAAIDLVKTVKYKIARKVSVLEEFKLEEYIPTKKSEFILTKDERFKKVTLVPLDQYAEHTDSYIHALFKTSPTKAKLYKSIDTNTGLNVLSIGEYRDIVSNNLWMTSFIPHDLRHIHYALSHPKAAAMLMGTARSQNHKRFTIMAGLYEGVDTAQYSHESALNHFFGKEIASSEILGVNRNMDLEEAMITIALASDKELDQILTSAGTNINSFVEPLAGWKPKKVAGPQYNGKANNGLSFQDDIDKMVEMYTPAVELSENMQRKLQNEAGNLTLSKKEEHFMKMMNYQLDPENPGIVIEGLNFKNDGRAHVTVNYGEMEDGLVIGIGDQ